MLGYGRGQLVGLHLSDLSDPEDRSDYTPSNSDGKPRQRPPTKPSAKSVTGVRTAA